MIETTVLNHLMDTMDTSVVYMEVPEDPPTLFVVVEKTGGGKTNHVGHATFAIQSYGESLLAAALLNEQVKEAMESLTEEKNVSRCVLDTDYNYTDTETKRYRYQAVFDITHYE